MAVDSTIQLANAGKLSKRFLEVFLRTIVMVCKFILLTLRDCLNLWVLAPFEQVPVWALKDRLTLLPESIALAAIDNLWKGAASQAVQNLNAMYGRNESEGLR